MILYAKANMSVKRYRRMLRDLRVNWYRVRSIEFKYDMLIADSNSQYEITIRMVSIELDEGDAALFKLRWSEHLLSSVI